MSEMTDQYESFIRERITKLRMEKNLSEFRLSLDLGHSKNYIQNISSGKSLPSVHELCVIFEHFKITPSEFFGQEQADSLDVIELHNLSRQLDEEGLRTMLFLARSLPKKTDNNHQNK